MQVVFAQRNIVLDGCRRRAPPPLSYLLVGPLTPASQRWSHDTELDPDTVVQGNTLETLTRFIRVVLFSKNVVSSQDIAETNTVK